MTRHFLEVDDLSASELAAVLELSERSPVNRLLDGRGVALFFEKPSNRTRNACEMAVVQLGGHPVTIRGDEVGLGSRETVEDIARTLGCYHAMIGARVADHSTLERMATTLDSAQMNVAVVNLLSDRGHPCQALADLLTLHQCFGSLEGLNLAYVGDSNNVCHSLCLAATLVGVKVRVASPKGFDMSAQDLGLIRALGGDVELTDDPAQAVAGADAVYTDVWTSMGQEDQTDERIQAFRGFTVTSALVDLAAPRAVVLHCLPAHRGEEISAEVFEGRRSVIWRQATNRMHAMRGLMSWLVAELMSSGGSGREL